jgi:hypothetical protein
MLAWCPSPATREEYDWSADDCGGSRWTARRYVRLAVAQPGIVLATGTIAAGDPAVWIEGAWFPDLDDAATKGCLLALVREAWPRMWVQGCPHHGGVVRWRLCDDLGLINYVVNNHGEFDSEIEALVAALEGAP